MKKPDNNWAPSATKPIIAPDGHVVLSQEDIDERKEREKEEKSGKA